MNAGRPLRFLGLTLGGWTTLRIVLLWPTPGSLPALVRAVAGGVVTRADAKPMNQFGMTDAVRHRRLVPQYPTSQVLPVQAPPLQSVHPATLGSALIAVSAPGLIRHFSTVPVDLPAPQAIDAPRPPLLAAGVDRWAASAWLLARGGRGGTLAGGRLGASQAGVRVTWLADSRSRIALAGRIATPLSGKGREAALGVDWQPTRLPVHLVAEQRVAIDGGRGGPTVGVIAGYGPGPLAAGFDLETYAQGGAIARGGVEGFVDAAARVTHPVRVGNVRLAVGVGGWGSAQRGAERLDVGPSIGVAVPVGQRLVRVALDWRERLAGDAHPGSGPALSIGSDF